MEWLIGAGGWSYFQLPSWMGEPLKWYAKAFNVVEINSTFYNMPSIGTVIRWRKIVPNNFEFTIKCHRSITHQSKLELNPQTSQTLEKLIEIGRILKAKIMVIQTPSTLKPTTQTINNLMKIAEITNNNIQIAWEPRGNQWKTTTGRELIRKAVEKADIIHCTDISREEPVEVKDTIYTRLFGKGEHSIYQFTRDEIINIVNKIIGLRANKAYVIAHTKKMYIDAARIKSYVEHGVMPKPTRNTGIKAVAEVLMEDTKFPIKKSELIKMQGWKVVPLNDEEVKLSQLLIKIPDKIYYNVNEICSEIEKMIS